MEDLQRYMNYALKRGYKPIKGKEYEFAEAAMELYNANADYKGNAFRDMPESEYDASVQRVHNAEAALLRVSKPRRRS